MTEDYPDDFIEDYNDGDIAPPFEPDPTGEEDENFGADVSVDPAPIPPDQMLGPENQVWRRWVEERFAELHMNLRDTSQIARNLTIGQAGVHAQLDETAATLEETTAIVEQQAEVVLSSDEPAQPTDPVLTSTMGQVTVNWDGLLYQINSSGNLSPRTPGAGFKSVIVQMSAVAPTPRPNPTPPEPDDDVLGPDDDTYFQEDEGTFGGENGELVGEDDAPEMAFPDTDDSGLGGELPDDEQWVDPTPWQAVGQALTAAGGVVVAPPAKSTRWFRLVSTDFQGRVSEGSAALSIVVAPTTLSEIEDAVSDKLNDLDQQIDDVRETADGKNIIVRSPNDASNPASYQAGDMWWKYNVGNQIIAMWIHTGSGWISYQMNGLLLAELNAGTITVGELNGALIKADSVQIASLLVSSLDNRVEDAGFERTSTVAAERGWNYPSGNGVTGTTNPRTGSRCLIATVGTGPYIAAQQVRPQSVSAGERYRVSFWIRASAAGATNNPVVIRFSSGLTAASLTAQPDLVMSATTGATSYTVGTSYIRVSAVYTVASTHKFTRFDIVVRETGTGRVFYIDDVEWYKMADAELIVDGSIMTPALSAGAVTADKLDVAAVQAKHVAIGDFTNLVPGGEFDTDGDFAAWKDSITGPVGTRVTDDTDGSPGALRVSAPIGGSAVNKTKYIRVSPGQKLRFTWSSKASADYNGTATNGKLRLGSVTSESGTGNLLTAWTWSSSTSWTTTTGYYTVPAGVSMIAVSLSFDHTAGTFWLDSVLARYMTEGSLLVDGAIDGKLITGATIRTAASNQRVQLDSFGLRTFNSSNTETSRLSAASGGFNLTGKLISGTPNGARAELDDAYVRFYGTGNSYSGGIMGMADGTLELTGGVGVLRIGAFTFNGESWRGEFNGGMVLDSCAVWQNMYIPQKLQNVSGDGGGLFSSVKYPRTGSGTTYIRVALIDGATGANSNSGASWMGHVYGGHILPSNKGYSARIHFSQRASGVARADIWEYGDENGSNTPSWRIRVRGDINPYAFELWALVPGGNDTFEVITARSEGGAGQDLSRRTQTSSPGTLYTTNVNVRTEAARPFAMAAGTVSFPSIAAGSTGAVTVTFPSGTFNDIPEVWATPITSIPQSRPASVQSRTSSAMTISQYNGTSSAGSVPVSWGAVQMSPPATSAGPGGQG